MHEHSGADTSRSGPGLVSPHSPALKAPRLDAEGSTEVHPSRLLWLPLPSIQSEYGHSAWL